MPTLGFHTVTTTDLESYGRHHHTQLFGAAQGALRFTKSLFRSVYFPLPPYVLPVHRELRESARCFVFTTTLGGPALQDSTSDRKASAIHPHQEYQRVQSSRWQDIFIDYFLHRSALCCTTRTGLMLVCAKWNNSDSALVRVIACVLFLV